MRESEVLRIRGTCHGLLPFVHDAGAPADWWTEVHDEHDHRNVFLLTVPS